MAETHWTVYRLVECYIHRVEPERIMRLISHVPSYLAMGDGQRMAAQHDKHPDKFPVLGND